MEARSGSIEVCDEEDFQVAYTPIPKGDAAKGGEKRDFTVQDAAEHLVLVKNARSALTLTDLNDSWQDVLADVLCALAGLLPFIGFFFVALIWYRYAFSKRKLLGDPLGSVLVNLLFLGMDQFLDAFSYIQYYREVKEGNLDVARALESLQYNSVCNLCAIASLIVSKILGAKTIEIYADVAFYKAKAKEDMQARCPEAFKKLLELEKYFPELYNSEPPPTSMAQMPQWSVISTRGKALTVLSTLFMCSGMCFMATVSFEGMLMTGTSRNAILVAASIFVAIYSVTFNWFKLVKGLLTAAEKIQVNADQLLLFTSLVRNQDYGRWTQENRQRIRNIFKHLEQFLAEKDEFAKEHSRFNETLGKKEALGKKIELADDEVKSLLDPDRVPDGQLNLVVDALDEALFHGEMSFELSRPQHIKEWWEMRRYLQLDFLDESSIMDYCSTCTLVLLACFLVVGFSDYSLHHDLIVSGDFSRCAGAFLATGLMLTLTIIIYLIINACINMNSLLMRDSSILLDASSEVRLGGYGTFSHGGIEERYNNADHVHRMEATASLLVLLEQKLNRFDEYQMLFGVPITSNFRNGIFATLGAAAVSYAWDFLYPLLMDLDLEQLVRHATTH